MPAAGSKFLYGDRDYVFNEDFFKKIVKENNISLSYKECKEIIETSNKNIADIVINEFDGFKLPYGMGYLVSSRFKPKNEAIDWGNTNKLGKRVVFLNLNTYGWSCRANWFRVRKVSNSHLHEVLKFQPYKTLSQAISTAFKNGNFYPEWKVNDFIERGRLENLYSKKFRTELKD